MEELYHKVWRDLLKYSTELNFKDGQDIFYEGHNPYGAFIILSGDVTLTKASDSEKKLSAPLTVPIGLDLLLTGQTYPFTAVANGPVQARFVSKGLLLKYCKHNFIQSGEEHNESV